MDWVTTSAPNYRSHWSDWSPSASWESTVGETKTKGGILDPDIPGQSITFTAVGSVVTLLLLVSVCICQGKLGKMIKRILIGPVPDPSKFFHGLDHNYNGNARTWPELFSVALHDEEISQIEIHERCDSVSPLRRKMATAALPEEIWDSTCGQSSSANFSNCSYFLSQCSRPGSTTTTNLDPCSVHSPYGPAGGASVQVEDSQQKDKGEDEGSKEWTNGGTAGGEMVGGEDVFSETPWVSPDEHVEKLQAQRLGLRSPDSGICSGGEELESQESVEDSDKGPGTVSHFSSQLVPLIRGDPFPKLPFTLAELSSGAMGGEVRAGCSLTMSDSYKRVEILQDQVQRQGLRSPDSGSFDGGQDQERQGSMQDKDRPNVIDFNHAPLGDNHFPFCSTPLPIPLNGLPQLPFTFPGLAPSLCLGSSLPGDLFKASSLGIEPSSGGYMPVKCTAIVRDDVGPNALNTMSGRSMIEGV
ncbi:hypothetical protein DPEC_G00171640 [Dallia pectoralis]|uniref:Uncharacterized protein n=1 Tax=Dallia pectoralis TaxID=75939 RepID=A0ACC2GDM3_DALPE|nr:hypothetical protein DPEC_G00171640 [Dallia pectoralis]